MSIFQFLTILWARKLLIAAATASCAIGGIVVMLLLPPRWQASARVMLNILKPDPVTGQMMGNFAKAYVDTQAALITDYSVAGQVPVKLGWLSDPSLISGYQRSAKPGGQDFQHWATKLLTDRTKVDMEGSNIIEIVYTSENPAQARAVVDALRTVYLDTTLTFRRAEALRNAQWYQDQAQKVRVSLDAAQAAVTDYERRNNVFMADDKTDVDTAQLHALTSQSQAPILAGSAGPSAMAGQLAELDTQIAQAAQKLGPNHPDLQAMKARRTALAGLAAKEHSAQSSTASAAAVNASALSRAVQEQKARVISKSDEIARLRQLQADVGLKQDQYSKMLARTADLTQEAAVADPGVSALGPATVSGAPSFPNKPLILGGSVLLGLGVGLLSALLAEFLGRRVRTTEDLQAAIDVPVLAVIPGGGLRKARAKSAGGAQPPKGRLAQA